MGQQPTRKNRAKSAVKLVTAKQHCTIENVTYRADPSLLKEDTHYEVKIMCIRLVAISL